MAKGKGKKKEKGAAPSASTSQPKLHAFYPSGDATDSQDSALLSANGSSIVVTRPMVPVLQEDAGVSSPEGSVNDVTGTHTHESPPMNDIHPLTPITDLPVPPRPRARAPKAKTKQKKSGPKKGPLDSHFTATGSASDDLPGPDASDAEGSSTIPVQNPAQNAKKLKKSDLKRSRTVREDHNEPRDNLNQTPSSSSQPAPLKPKALHPLFQAKQRAASIIDVDDDDPHSQGSVDAPIQIDDSPVQPSNIMRSKAPLNAPWPTADTQHTQGQMNTIPPTHISLFPYRKTKPSSSRDSGPDLPFPRSPYLSDGSHSPLPLRAPLSDSFTPHQLPQAILDRFQTRTPLPGPELMPKQAHQDYWAEKWRPMKASQVLGNESNAQYIKEWLLALELSLDNADGGIESSIQSANKGKGKSLKRKQNAGPTVIRAVTKRKGRKRQKLVSDSDDLGWIAYSDEEDEEGYASSSHISVSTLGAPSSSPAPEFSSSRLKQQRPKSPTPSPKSIYDFSALLTNALLICGPPGSGKTAAVYACAAELGWEIFEANPGSTKRTGYNVSQMMDGVGKNHTLGGAAQEKEEKKERGSKAAFGALFGKAKAKSLSKTSSTAGLAGTEDEPIDIEGTEGQPDTHREKSVNFVKEDDEEETTKIGTTKKKVNQSIILLEEVDVLFRDEGSFWGAVVNIIKESRRPVIMTCNDQSLIPQEDLPLQTVLDFEPCPPSLITTYLQQLCNAEGYRSIPRDTLHLISAFTHRPLSFDYPDQPMHPVPTQPLPCPDLRRAIHQTQLLCQSQRDQTLWLDPIGGNTIDWWWDGEKRYLFEHLSDWGSVVRRHSYPENTSTPEDHEKEAKIMRCLSTFSDCVSFADWAVDRRTDDAMEAYLVDDYGDEDFTCADDQLGHHILRKPAAREAQSLAAYNRDEEIALELLYEARCQLLQLEHRHECSLARTPTLDNADDSYCPPSTHRLALSRASHQSRTVHFMGGLLSLSSPLLPSPALTLDYIPYVRQMVLTDDVDQRAEEAGDVTRMGGRSRSGRLMRVVQAKRPPFVRYMPLNGDELRAVRESMFLE